MNSPWRFDGRVPMVVLALLAVALGPSSPEAAGKPIVIPTLMNLTGPNSDFGKRGKIALTIAMERINAAGGVNGSPISLDFLDTATSPQQAALLIRKHAPRAFMFIGPSLSSEAEVACAIANELKVPIVNGTSKPGIAARNRPWVFRDSAPESEQQSRVVKAFTEHHPRAKRIALVVDVKSAWAKNLGTRLFPAILKQHGLTVVNEANPITLTTGTIDLSTQVTALRALNPEGLALAMVYQEAASLAKEMERQGLKVPVIGSLGVAEPSLIQLGGKSVEGWLVPGTYDPNAADPELAGFIHKFESLAREVTPDAPQPGYMDINLYDVLMISASIMKAAGVNGDTPVDKAREVIRQGWATLKNFPGIAGKVSIDKDGEGIRQTYVLAVKNGKQVLVK